MKILSCIYVKNSMFCPNVMTVYLAKTKERHLATNFGSKVGHDSFIAIFLDGDNNFHFFLTAFSAQRIPTAARGTYER